MSGLYVLAALCMPFYLAIVGRRQSQAVEGRHVAGRRQSEAEGRHRAPMEPGSAVGCRSQSQHTRTCIVFQAPPHSNTLEVLVLMRGD